MDISTLYPLFLQASGVTTDTRQVAPGNMFFALKGPAFDGNAFAQQALDAGAAFAVIDDPAYAQNDHTILVQDVLDTMQQLALHHRRVINPKAVIAITGSNGKTTTKELVHAVLATTFQTHYTQGNLNNHIGIPLTLLRMPAGTELAVIEMGANHRQEIAGYCRFTEPTHGIITNCGKAHLEGFGGIEGIRRGKGELYDHLKEHQGLVFVNGDDDVLLAMLHERGIQDFITYGSREPVQYHGAILTEQPVLGIAFEDIVIKPQLFGRYNYSNIMCAVAVGKHFGVSHAQIKAAIEAYQPANSRSQVVERDGYTLILDAYNANPTSMQHALESFANSGTGRKVVILGDMFELGEFSTKEHQQIADLCVSLRFDVIALVGQAFGATSSPGGNVIKFPDAAEAQTWFRQQDFSGSAILLKGSRGMYMEKVIA